MSALERPTLFFTDEQSFRDWLAANHAAVDGIWLKFAKKGSGYLALEHSAALRQALCFGWIDGQARPLDEEFYLVGFTPRRRRSPWSQRNQGLVAELIEQGLMHPAGQAEIDRAKADGRWENASGRELPEDFLAALARHPEAAAFFETLPMQSRIAVGYHLGSAVRPETRARRLEQLIRKLADGQPL
ncbi:YdeI/OmpD-associated family protein [Nocardia sp. NBC_01503]|uniref:YdeI/OmpD-associated family protein n=1 Tax=Nocardia sp. NBC_01503 TaxID=2975997 RepID=UPI002E7BDA11|nr:YdeI/OmpD-associated family protein [Nocardia sp. NBC_01503]WTL33813.1 YdeI/OmpD-associated family protein [Nocardia sp. NBC_01503]